MDHVSWSLGLFSENHLLEVGLTHVNLSVGGGYKVYFDEINSSCEKLRGCLGHLPMCTKGVLI